MIPYIHEQNIAMYMYIALFVYFNKVHVTHAYIGTENMHI